MYLQRPDNINPHPSIAKPKYSFDHEALAHLNKNNSDVSNIKNIFHAPRSLAKVSHKSKEMSHSELEKWNLNGSSNDISVNDEKSSTKGKSYTKGKSFSINHYDIYRPGFLINRQDLEARNEISRIKKVEEKDTSMV